MRRAVIEALGAQRDPRVVPMLVRIIEESEPLGKDYEVVLETIEALGLVPSDAGITALARIIARRGFSGAGRRGPSRSEAWVPWPGSGPPQRRLSSQMRRKPGTGC